MPGAGHTSPWLVVVDVQRIFVEPGELWYTPSYAGIGANIGALASAMAPRCVFTRFVAPATPAGAWLDYYRRWPTARRAADDPGWALAVHPAIGRTVDAPTFNKWCPELRAVVGEAEHLLLCGLTTDCCVLATALAAADDGRSVSVVTDATCAGTDALHAAALEILSARAPLISLTTTQDLLANQADEGES
jgi:nicotinamidase-related amidase